MRLLKQHKLLKVVHSHGINYPSPLSINYLWNFGSLALACLGIQFISGIFLSHHYVAIPSEAFNSVLNIMLNVNNGWFIRYLHANGASFFFLVVYIHIFRGLYYGSYLGKNRLTWIIGVFIVFLMIATAFMGYVLPWGQMSYWAATVITNLFSAIPLIGPKITVWIWGGFSITDTTLTRFYSFHFMLPFILIFLVFVHIILLHDKGSNNPLGLTKIDTLPLTPYFVYKDLFGVIFLVISLFFMAYFFPEYLGHPDNSIRANPLVTPTHIVPEWYFLPFYAILRSVPNKLWGVILMVISILILIILPFVRPVSFKSNQFKPFSKFFFWIFIIDCLLLGWLGGNVAEDPYVILSRICTSFYFIYFILIVPLCDFTENRYLKVTLTK